MIGHVFALLTLRIIVNLVDDTDDVSTLHTNRENAGMMRVAALQLAPNRYNLVASLGRPRFFSQYKVVHG